MNAQISSCRTGERRVQELVEKFGVETFELAVEEILDHGERLARSRLANLPKGTWTAVDYADDDGIDRDTLVKIQATVTITDDEVVIDFAGSDPATAGPINIPIGCTIGIGALVFKALTTPDTPANEGNFRPSASRRPRAVSCTRCHRRRRSRSGRRCSRWSRDEGIRRGYARRDPRLLGRRHLQRHGRRRPSRRRGSSGSRRPTKAWASARTPAGDGENGMMHMTEPGCRNNPIEVLERRRRC